MSLTKAYNFKQINELVSSSGTIKHINLISESYQLVVNLLPNDSEHARENEQQDLEALAVDFYYIPVDWNNPKDTDYADFESVMNRYPNQKVHVHCAANYRATAFYGVYAVNNLGWSKQQLDELMASIWQLNDYALKYIGWCWTKVLIYSKIIFPSSGFDGFLWCSKYS